MRLFGKPVRVGRFVRRLGGAKLEISIEKAGRGLIVRGTVSGRPGRIEVLRLPVPPTFLMNNWQSWGPTQKATPADTFPELGPIHATSPYGFSPLLGELLPRVWSDYFIAWDRAVLGFLASRIAHPFFLVEGAELVGYLEYFDVSFDDPVPLEPLAILSGGDVEDLLDVYGNMQNYIWRRNDTLGGVSNSIGWLTTAATKERMLTYFKDFFERNMLDIWDMDTVEEMKTVVREDGGIAASGRNKDDRVIAMALACAAFAEQVQPRLIGHKILKKISKAQDNFSPEELAVGRNVSDYLKRIGVYGK